MMDRERVGRAYEELAEGARGSWAMVFDQAIRLSERNVSNFWNVFGDVSREVVSQVEVNRALSQELVRRAEAQRGKVKTILDEATDAYLDLLYLPVSLYGEGLKRGVNGFGSAVAGVAEAGAEAAGSQGAAVSDILTGLPIQDYDELNAAQVTERLDGLSQEDLKKIRAYEERNKNRRSLIAQIDRRVQAVS